MEMAILKCKLDEREDYVRGNDKILSQFARGKRAIIAMKCLNESIRRQICRDWKACVLITS
jgi:hypothetical protein